MTRYEKMCECIDSCLSVLLTANRIGVERCVLRQLLEDGTFRRIQRSKVHAAHIVSQLLTACDYEPDDYDPSVMQLLDREDCKS